jgi:multiple sugar transport system ATP-binding protein
MSEVCVRNLLKKFGDVSAVDRVSFTFPDTELTVLVGPSGCGKTTLLRTIAGLEEPTDGEIFIGDQVVNEIPPWDRNTAMVFQSYALYPHMNVFRNMAFPLEAHKVPKAEIKESVERTAAMLGIDQLLDRRPRELSGGQMQRVAIGRAIVRNPEVYLMDEPLSNLDAKLRVNMRADLKRLQKELGVTTIYVTHDQAEAMTIADLLVVMRDGQIQQAGHPEEIYFHPRTMFVGTFIGSPSMNLIPCHLDATQQILDASAFTYPVPPRLRDALQGSDGAARPTNLVLGVRPEDITVVPESASGADDGSILTSVYMTEPMGKEILVTLNVGDLQLKAFAPARLQPAIDEQLWISFDPESVHLFDGDSEMAIA